MRISHGAAQGAMSVEPALVEVACTEAPRMKHFVDPFVMVEGHFGCCPVECMMNRKVTVWKT
jgi:hypothetical protein